jgi:hypothetical protein
LFDLSEDATLCLLQIVADAISLGEATAWTRPCSALLAATVTSTSSWILLRNRSDTKSPFAFTAIDLGAIKEVWLFLSFALPALIVVTALRFAEIGWRRRNSQRDDAASIVAEAS